MPIYLEMNLETLSLVEVMENNDDGFGASLYFKAVDDVGNEILLKALAVGEYRTPMFETIALSLDEMMETVYG